MATQKVWLITGCSSGFGQELAKQALLTGAKVAVTDRDILKIKGFDADYPENALLLTLDVTDMRQIKAAVDETKRMFGHIDVLVNNAGYGLLGAIEEVPDKAVRKLFDTNFFGYLAVTRAVLPIMREQKSGYIVNISSIAGFVGAAGMGLYNASKFAVEGFTEALALEVAPLGINVILIEPGPFRTHFEEHIKLKFPAIAAYSSTRGLIEETVASNAGKEPSDRQKAAKTIISLIESTYPPLHLPLGRIAVDRMREKISDLTESISAWEKISVETDFKK